MKNYIQITIKTKKETHHLEYAQRFFAWMTDFDGRLAPEFFDTYWSTFNTTPYEAMNSLKENWCTTGYTRTLEGAKFDSIFGCQWKRRRPPVYNCQMYHTFINVKGQIMPSRFSFRANWREDIDWYALFHGWCKIAEPQIAMLHHFTAPELHNPHADFSSGTMGNLAGPTYPDLAWAMIFNDQYRRIVDVERWTSMGFPVEPMGSGYLVRVTNSLLDISKRFDFFAQRRDLLRQQVPPYIFTPPDDHYDPAEHR